MWTNISKGIIIGLITGMPLGPIGAICLKVTLTKGVVYGLFSGLGSAIADSFFAILAALGSSIIMDFVLKNQLYFHFFGGIVLIILGIHMFLSKHTNTFKEKEVKDETLLKSFLSTFFLALINPATILTFFVLFTSPQFSDISNNILSKIFLILGVFIGSMVWWFILIFAVSSFKESMNLSKMKFVNTVISFVICFSGFYMFLTVSNYSKYIGLTYLHTKLLEVFLDIKSKIPFYK